jgi:hypothetical protein
MLAADDWDAANVQEAYFQDKRISQYWDGEQVFGRLAARGLGLNEPVAWDIYLLYHPGTIWVGGKMPAPNFWMHQLNERPDLLLNPVRLMAEVQEAIQSCS